jgi:hypothetical protein
VGSVCPGLGLGMQILLHSPGVSMEVEGEWLSVLGGFRFGIGR